MAQIEIDGIGQQKATLSCWKKENKVFTHHASHMEVDNFSWSCWGETSDPELFMQKYGDHNMGFGNSEKACITNFCQKHEITLPFWWV